MFYSLNLVLKDMKLVLNVNLKRQITGIPTYKLDTEVEKDKSSALFPQEVKAKSNNLEYNQFRLVANEPAHEIMVLTTQVTSEGSGKPVHLYSLPEPLQFTHMKYGSRRRVRPKIRHLAPLDGCACTFEKYMEDEKSHNLMTWLKSISQSLSTH